MGVPFVFIHAADLHLDSPFKGLSRAPQAVRHRLRESTFASFRRIADIAVREKADFVVLAGDLYDAADRSLRAQLRLQRILTELSTEAGIRVFAVHGNHDPESGRQARLEWPPGVHVFGSADVECVEARRRDGVLVAHVYGISYPSAAVTDNLALRFERKEGAPFHLALLHGNVDGNPFHDNYAPCKLSDLLHAGFDYWALGHVHDRRVLHTYPHVVYPGNIQGRSMRETGPKGVYVVRVSEAGEISLSFRDTADVLWMETAVSIEGADREQQLKERLLQAVEEVRSAAGGRPVVLRMRIEGRGALHQALLRDDWTDEWLEELRDWLGTPDGQDNWVWPESIMVRTAAAADWSQSAEEDGFVGELVRRGMRLSDSPDECGAWVDDALDLLRRQSRLRAWLASCSGEQRQELTRRALALAVSLLQGEGERS
jgi:DNA repair exonuclease SbcCD nuclease subunit